MPQQTNLNISPYYDDYDRDSNYYRVLFKPGFPVQARELTTLQSILQNQVEQFGSHIFKEGSVVIPGGVTYDGDYFAVRLDSTHLGIDIELYLKQLVGKRIKGQNSGITAKVINYITGSTSISSDPTIYVKYLVPGPSNEFSFFQDNELLVLQDPITYGNTTINTGSTFASTLVSDACFAGSAISISSGVYFVRGTFANVNKQTLILDQYDNKPFYRVGLKVVETVVNAKDDPSLYDNAKGFSNFAAPGADRLKIDLILSKKELEDYDDTDFVELVRVRAGVIEKEIKDSQYNLIRDYLAKRTYDESGDYTVKSFKVNISESLNDRAGNNGIFFDDATTYQGNVPSDDLACVKVSAGSAYIKGYEYDTAGDLLDVEKPRTTSELITENLPYTMGNRIRVNAVSGITTFRNSIDLLAGNQVGVASEKIGDAKVYNFGLVDAKYEDNSTEWDLFLYDVQTYTKLDINEYVSSSEVIESTYVIGKDSGASGYTIAAGAGSSTLTLTQTSGRFLPGEQLIFNGREANLSRTVEKITAFGFDDISAFQQSNTFYANKALTDRIPFGFTASDNITITTGGVVSSPGRTFERFKPGDVIRYNDPTKNLITQNVVSSVSADAVTMNVVGMNTVANLFEGGRPVGSAYTGTFRVGGQITDDSRPGLYLDLPVKHVSNVDFTDSTLLLSEQVTNESTDGDGVLVVNTSALSLNDVSFVAFDQERYQVQYSDGTIAPIDGSQVTTTANTLTINNLTASQSGIKVNVTVQKTNVKNKVKEFKRSEIVKILYSNDVGSGLTANSSKEDGLLHTPYYGLRVQDQQICLNYPDVVNIVAVYESLDSNDPVLDKLVFTSTDGIFTNAIIGEEIVGSVSNAVARVVSIDPIGFTISVVYKTSTKFQLLEVLNFKESNSRATLQNVSPGKYKNLTKSFLLGQGQKEQYSDYSRLKRINNGYVPSKRLLVVLDRYQVPSTDTGDVFTVNSYNEELYKNRIPKIGPKLKRAVDVLDFRPRVSQFVPSAATYSPFYYKNRTFAGLPSRLVAPDESMQFGYQHYYGRVDKLVIRQDGEVRINKGVPSRLPKAPADDPSTMTLAVMAFPPYLYDTDDVSIYMIDNKRYTMRDIGRIEDRVENLEQVTNLSFLEQKAETIQVRDADGLDRFKSGFFADPLKNRNFIQVSSPVDVNTDRGHITPLSNLDSIDLQVVPATDLTPSQLDYSQNFDLLDSNTRKTGRMVTLDYEEETYVEQIFATRVENLNPYLVWNYQGNVKLSPTSDNWINTERTETLTTQEIPITVFDTRVTTNTVDGGFGQDELNSTTTETSSTRRDDIESRNTYIREETFDPFIRSRNIQFNVTNLRPRTQYYVFFDNVGSLDIIPKLIPINSVSGAFQVGETIRTANTDTVMRFRLCRPDHKEGPFNSPTKTYEINPLTNVDTPPPQAYSQGSTLLNIDIEALSQQAQGDFFGFLEPGTVVFGETSGAQATISAYALYSDNYGDLTGSIWVRNPNETPTPLARIRSGEREVKITSSSTNASGLLGSTATSSGTATYTAVGTTRQIQTDISITTIATTTVVRDVNITLTNRRPPPPPPPPPPVIINNTTVIDRTRTVVQQVPARVPPRNPPRRDPLAQTFKTDRYGAYVTSIDVFFASLDPNATDTAFVEIRPVELGLPTGAPITSDARVDLRARDITPSTDASVATRFTFPSPIYLEPEKEYCFVLGSSIDTYEAWIARMGDSTVNAQSLPNAVGTVYNQQFAVGSLFKSQNASTWTPCQFEDLTFRINRAKFVTTPGTVTLQNPPLNATNNLLPALNNNPIEVLPKKASIGFTTTQNAGLIGTVFVPGRKVGDATETFRSARIEDKGGPAHGVPGINTGGLNYGNPTGAVQTFNITGRGSGLTLNVTVGAGISAISAVSIASSGSGYKVGDVVGLVTADMGGSGLGARIGINTIAGVDTLYLTDIQAEEFTAGGDLTYTHTSGSVIDTTLDLLSYNATGSVYTGEYARVSSYNHGMYGIGNKVEIANVSPDGLPTEVSTDITASTTTISVASTAGFSVFEGVTVSAANTGFAIINNEIISYTSVGVNTLGGIVRGTNNTAAINHANGSSLQKYEISGVSLTKINTTHDVENFGKQMDSYLIKIDREGRSTDNNTLNFPQLSFSSNAHVGGANVTASKNIQYNAVRPLIDITAPGFSDSVTFAVRTVSGTSVDGSETSFVDLGYENFNLNEQTALENTRIVCSEVNENEKLGSLFRNKSISARLTLSNGGDFYNSPMLCLDTMSMQLYSYRLNDPIDNYAIDARANAVVRDPHASYYLSKLINLKQPATSLRVVFDAFRPSSSDFRVLYSVIRPDSSEEEPTFELFPGYNNMIDTDGDGFGDIAIDPKNNDGLPDKFVQSDTSFREYQYTINDIEPFTSFVIKIVMSGTNQAKPPVIKNIRAVALA
jgi:hypothetical protein